MNAWRPCGILWRFGVGRAWDDLSERYKDGLAKRIHIIEATEGPLYHDVAGVLATRALDDIETPALLMHGAQTEAVIPVINAGLARRLRHSTTVEIAGASHMMPLTHPADCAREIRSFLAQV